MPNTQKKLSNNSKKSYRQANYELLVRLKSNTVLVDENERKQLMEELYNLNYKLISTVISQQSLRGSILSYEDLYSVAYLVLERCVKNFDVTKGLSFSTYFVEAMKKAFKREIDEKKLNIGLAQNSREKFCAAENKLKMNNLDESTENLVKESGLSEREVEALLRAERIQKAYSIFDSVISNSTDDDMRIVDNLLPDESQNVERIVMKNLTVEYVIKLIEILEKENPKQALIIRLYFGLNEEEKKYTYQEIASLLNISRQRVEQILKQGLNQLRNIARANDLHDIL
ncbi:MAG: sigma-70 family RNA polymerase sigma factor [Candidatus Micrarchaeota archaeon]|nr:sigma-70 family RNA polymerase sigma factor [Candidatus Micrarchaeota archaeon]